MSDVYMSRKAFYCYNKNSHRYITARHTIDMMWEDVFEPARDFDEFDIFANGKKRPFDFLYMSILR